MRRTFPVLLLLSALGTALPGVAQSWRVDVPFDFTAQSHEFQAGAYELSIGSHLNFILLRSAKDPNQQMQLVTTEGDSDALPPVLRFTRAQDQYNLVRIQAGTRVTLPLSRSERRRNGLSVTASGR